jgi:pyridoxal 5'-phosphate synthase pdxS subunit
MKRGTIKVKAGLAEMLKGGVIMDVTNVKQAKIAEEAGAVSVMALERIPADIRAAGGIYSGYGKGKNRTFWRSTGA